MKIADALWLFVMLPVLLLALVFHLVMELKSKKEKVRIWVDGKKVNVPKYVEGKRFFKILGFPESTKSILGVGTNNRIDDDDIAIITDNSRFDTTKLTRLL